MTELAFRSATALVAAIRARQIGCRELLEHYLVRVERHNPALNAIIVTDLAGARPRPDLASAGTRPPRRRWRARSWRELGRPAWLADDGEGIFRRRGPADDLGT